VPIFKSSDIPDMSDKELEQFLNITIAELAPGNSRIQNQFYNHGVCIVADLLKIDQEKLSLGPRSHKTIGQALWAAIQAIKRGEQFGVDPRS